MSEDLTTYTVYDPPFDVTNFVFSPSPKGITASTITFGFGGNQVYEYVVKDFGVNYFHGNFSINFTFYLDTNIAGPNICFFLALTNTIGNWENVGRSQASLSIRLQASGISASQDNSQGNVVGLSAATIYYCTFSYDASVGAFGTIYVKIYSDSNRTTLVGTSTFTMGQTINPGFRYLSVMMGSGVESSGGCSGYIANINMHPPYLYPTDPMVRVTGITRTFWTGKGGQGLYQSQLTLGGNQASYISPISNREPTPVLPPVASTPPIPAKPQISPDFTKAVEAGKKAVEAGGGIFSPGLSPQSPTNPQGLDPGVYITEPNVTGGIGNPPGMSPFVTPDITAYQVQPPTPAASGIVAGLQKELNDLKSRGALAPYSPGYREKRIAELEAILKQWGK